MRLARSAALFLAGAASVFAVQGIAQVFPGVSFPDVMSDAFYAPSVERLVRGGVMRGYDNGRFGSDDAMTRGQAATIFDRYDRRFVDPIREQMREVREKLGLGVCGDDEIDTGEQCDDGNLLDGDGCSVLCQTELGSQSRCSDGHMFGDQYIGEDGCNTCTCSRAGIACTRMACPEPTEPDGAICFQTSDCGSGEICTTELGICESRCPAGVDCTARCTGTCIQRGASCGNDVCDSNETGYYTRSSTIMYCPEDCRENKCGNGVCEREETDDAERDPYDILCPEDCGGEVSLCEQEKDEYQEIVSIHKSCIRDSDCAVFQYSCPYVTCGEAVNAEGLTRLHRQSEDIVSICQREGEVFPCASCVAQHAVCENSKCVLRDGL